MKLHIRWNWSQNRYIVTNAESGETLMGLSLLDGKTANNPAKVRYYKPDGSLWTEDYYRGDSSTPEARKALVAQLVKKHGFLNNAQVESVVDRSEVPRGLAAVGESQPTSRAA